MRTDAPIDWSLPEASDFSVVEAGVLQWGSQCGGCVANPLEVQHSSPASTGEAGSPTWEATPSDVCHRQMIARGEGG